MEPQNFSYLQEIFSMKNIFLFLLLPVMTFAQFKNDNVLYKTIYWQQFCQQFPGEKEALLLDVRSQGEYADTSPSSSLNIGHLKGATHINVSELGKRLSEINAYKYKPVYIYCSHSQRSRRSSKMLVDSGFTNVININGGLTDLYLTDPSSVPCKTGLLQTSNTWQQYNPQQLADLLKTNPGITIIDVRSDSAFKAISNVEKDKALGKLNGSVNIPLNQLENSLEKLPKNKPVLLVDAYGDESAKAASLLSTKGYTNIYTLFNGLDAWLQLNNHQQQLFGNLIDRKIGYKLLDAETFATMAATGNAFTLDIRPAEEFTNTSSEGWRNRGHIKGSVNIPAQTLATAYTSLSTTKPIIVTGFGNSPEAFEAAEFLTIKGYNNIYVLTPGIWGLRYRAFNYPNSMQLNNWVVDVPEENR
jgi:rhodanese-related sulfurtransferase